MNQRLVRDSSAFIAAAAVMALLQVLYRVVAAGGVDRATYGRAALVLALFNGLLVVAHFGVPVATARLAPHVASRRQGRRLMMNAAQAVVLPCLASTAVLTIASWELVGPMSALWAALGMPPMAASFVVAGYLRGRGAVAAAAAIQPLNAATQLIALVGWEALGHVSAIAILLSFYAGNGVAFVASALLLARLVRSDRPDGRGVSEQGSPRRLLAFSAWLTLSSALLYLLALLPRLVFVGRSYSAVALLDLALLVYTLPQRFIASFVTALVPLASRPTSNERFRAPGAADTILLACVGVAAASASWATRAPEHAFELVGLHRYAAAGSMFSILLLAVPAELLYAYEGGLLQAAGRSRSLACATGAGAAVGGCLLVASSFVSLNAVAASFAASYWLLLAAVRIVDRSTVVDRTTYAGRTVRRLRTRSAAA